jgi:hypothetical protein
LPALSLAGHVTAAGAAPHGGPTVPCTTENTVDTAPLAEVVTRADSDGAVQLTEMDELMMPPSMTVGWFGSLLHSSTLPIELSANPLPVRVTLEPLVRPVVGVPVKDAAA